MVTKKDQRKYDDASEIDRRIHYSRMKLKNNSFYNKKDNLWNEPQRLDQKKFARYSEKNINPKTSFKKTIKDFPKIIQQERELDLENQYAKIRRLKQEESARINNRKLERHVLQYQSSQNLSDD